MLNLVSYVEQKISEGEDRVFLPYTFPHGSHHKTVDEATSKCLAVLANVPLFEHTVNDKILNLQIDQHSYYLLPTPLHPELSLVLAAIFLAMVLAALPGQMRHIWVDSLCSPGLVDWLAAIQVGFTGVGADGHS